MEYSFEPDFTSPKQTIRIQGLPYDRSIEFKFRITIYLTGNDFHVQVTLEIEEGKQNDFFAIEEFKRIQQIFRECLEYHFVTNHPVEVYPARECKVQVVDKRLVRLELVIAKKRELAFDDFSFFAGAVIFGSLLKELRQLSQRAENPPLPSPPDLNPYRSPAAD